MQNAGDVSNRTGPETPSQAEPGLRFENVRLVKGGTGMGLTGVLIARGDSLEFQSKKGTLAPIR